MIKQPAIMQLAGVDERDTVPTEEEADQAPPPRIIDFDLDPKPIGVDAAGQQGLIKSFVYRQPDPERLHLMAKYSHGEERRVAQRALRDYLLPLINNAVRPRYVIFMLVTRFYGRREVSFKDLSVKVLYLVPAGDEVERHKEAWRMVRDLAADVDNLLKDLATRSEELAHAELKAKGVIA